MHYAATGEDSVDPPLKNADSAFVRFHKELMDVITGKHGEEKVLGEAIKPEEPSAQLDLPLGGAKEEQAKAALHSLIGIVKKGNTYLRSR